MDRKLRMGMVGGGPGSFIGDVHRKAALFDGGVELIGGCFSQAAEKTRALADALYLNRDRAYGTYREMIDKEGDRKEGDRVDFVVIATPNDSHFEIASAFLEAGFHVILDKPMTHDVPQALALRDVVRRGSALFALTHNYTGYPMVKLARDLVRQNRLGALRKVAVHYPQGWLARPIERDGSKQAAWRTDPRQSGAAGSMGDIGTHADNLAAYITGLRIRELCADLARVVTGRALDDDGHCLLRYEGGARGILTASQICIGELNGLRIHVYGENGSLFWRQETPNELPVYREDGTVEVFRCGTEAVAALSPAAARATRLPFGHPEGFYEAFANIYRNALDTLRARLDGREPTELERDFPDVEDGVRGMQFIETVVASEGRWLPFPPV